MSAIKATRNFFVDALFDDWHGTRRKKWGPRPAPDAGFSMKVFMLRDGARVVAAEITGVAGSDGSLRVLVKVPGDVTPSGAGARVEAVGSRARPKTRYWRARRSVER